MHPAIVPIKPLWIFYTSRLLKLTNGGVGVTTRTLPDLKELFKQASEIAQQVPANMQEAAFNRALELLTAGTLGSAPAAHREEPPAKATKTKRSAGRRGSGDTTEAGNRVETLLQKIDSTQHPGVVSVPGNLERALMVLKIAYDEHQIDGLSPSDIARVLRDKFRVSAADNAIRMALTRASTLVDRVPNGSGFIYRIMAPGEAHLAALVSGGAADRNEGGKTAPRGRKAKRPQHKAAESAAGSTGKASAPPKPSTTKAASPPASAGKKRASGNPGPKAAVMSLHASGYFDTPRTGAELQQHLKDKKGLSFDLSQLLVALLRLVRDEVLDRDTNSNGDYEYKRHK